MNHLLKFSVLILLFGFQSCSTSAQERESASAPKIVEVNEAADLMAKGDILILDVRTSEEVSQGFIEGAENLDIFDWEAFTSGVEELDKTVPVMVYCKVGGRSQKAAKYLADNGFDLVYDLGGGIIAWQEAGKSLVKK